MTTAQNGRKKGISRSIINVILFLAAFIFCGVFHCVLYGLCFANCTVQLLLIFAVVFWMITLKNRITDMRLQRVVLLIGVMIIFYLTLQITKYRLVINDVDIKMYIMYAFNIPTIVGANFAYEMSLLVFRPQEKKVEPKERWPWLVTFAVLTFIFTNDLHGLAYDTLENPASEKRNVLGYIFIVWLVAVVALTFINFIRKNRFYIKGKDKYLPLIPPACFALYYLFYALNIDPKFNGTRMWNTAEVFCFAIIGFIEICIQIGLIPSNTGYRTLFTKTNIKAKIADDRGDVMYAGGTVAETADENIRISTHAIPGGRIEWEEDISRINGINRSIEETNQNISSRNDYLKTENEIKQEKAEVDAKKQIYDTVSEVVSSQIEHIQKLLELPDFEKRLPEISVYNAYIKRRCNLELLKEQKETNIQELKMSVDESLKYMGLCGISTSSVLMTSGTFNTEYIILAYEQFERIVESVLHDIKSLSVILREKNGLLNLRVTVDTDFDGNGLCAEADGSPVEYDISREVDSTIISVIIGNKEAGQ